MNFVCIFKKVNKLNILVVNKIIKTVILTLQNSKKVAFFCTTLRKCHLKFQHV